MHRILSVLCLLVAPLCASEEPVHLPVPPPDTAPKKPAEAAAKPVDPPVSEEIVRQRFLLAYQTSRTSELKAQSVELLQGLKEPQSLRMIAGMLGATDESVRMAACDVMAETDDPDGYFVKWLTGALGSDPSMQVRGKAAKALANAKNNDSAMKALTYALMLVAGEPADADPNVESKALLVRIYNQSLEKITGQKSVLHDSRGLSNFWMGIWKQREAASLQADRKEAPAGAPQRREGLAPDTFDKIEVKK